MKVNSKVYKWLIEQERKRFNFLWGGAASGKSWGLAQYLVAEKFLKEPRIGILGLRRTYPEVRTSCLRLVDGLLTALKFDYGLKYDENKSSHFFKSEHGSYFYFGQVDDVMKQKSIEGVNYIWIEEATEFIEKEFMQLNLRMRAANPHGINRLFLTFNPEDPIGNEWLKKRTDLANTKPDSAALHINYDENPFLAAEEAAQIAALADQDQEYDAIYRRGEWATPTFIIYTNWKIIDKLPERYDDKIWGLDFGYSSNEAALIEIRIIGNSLYEKEHIYEKELTNPMLIDKLKQIIPDPYDMIIADSAEPKSIQEIRNAGFNIIGCRKGKDSVCFGIQTVKACKTYITADSVNLIREKKGYKWRQDKNGEVFQPPQPLKFQDHGCDAERYAVSHVRGFLNAGIIIPDDIKGDNIGNYREDNYSDIDDPDEWDASEELWKGI